MRKYVKHISCVAALFRVGFTKLRLVNNSLHRGALNNVFITWKYRKQVSWDNG